MYFIIVSVGFRSKNTSKVDKNTNFLLQYIKRHHTNEVHRRILLVILIIYNNFSNICLLVVFSLSLSLSLSLEMTEEHFGCRPLEAHQSTFIRYSRRGTSIPTTVTILTARKPNGVATNSLFSVRFYWLTRKW